MAITILMLHFYENAARWKCEGREQISYKKIIPCFFSKIHKPKEEKYTVHLICWKKPNIVDTNEQEESRIIIFTASTYWALLNKSIALYMH